MASSHRTPSVIGFMLVVVLLVMNPLSWIEAAPSTLQDEKAARPTAASVIEDANKLETKELLEALQGIRKLVDERLLKPSKTLLAEHSKYTGGQNQGINRILQRGKFEGMTTERGGGAYFSFTSRTNDYNRQPIIELQNGKFDSGFAGGDYGEVHLLPTTNFEALTLQKIPARLQIENPHQFKDVGRQSRHQDPPAEMGAVYAVRCVLWEEVDIIAAFKIVQLDEDGATFIWKILKRFPTPSRR